MMNTLPEAELAHSAHCWEREREYETALFSKTFQFKNFKHKSSTAKKLRNIKRYTVPMEMEGYWEKLLSFSSHMLPLSIASTTDQL